MKNILLLARALFVFLFAMSMHGQTVTWTNTSSGTWGTALNWSPNGVPNSNNVVIINQPGVTVTLNGVTTAGAIAIGTNSGSAVTLAMNGQTLTLYGPLTVNPSGSFTVDSGNLSGSTNAVLSGTIGWTAGSLSGILTLNSNGALNITGSTLSMNGTLLTNNGTVTWTSGTIQTGNSSAVYNYGLWNMTSDQVVNTAFGGASAFNNYGTVRKSGGAGQFVGATFFQGNAAFNQIAGVIDVQNGIGTNGTELAFQAGGTFTGGYITTNQYGLTVLSVGNFTINGTVTGTNTWEDTGNLVGNNIINGALTWVGGNWNGAPSVTVASNATLLIVGGGGVNDLSACQMTNNGTVDWLNGTIRGGNGTTVYNNGLWAMTSDQVFNNAYGGTGSTINNFGTLRKSGGAGQLVGATIFQSGVVFNQLAGVIDVQNGIGTNGTELAFQGNGTFTGGYITTNQYGLTVLSSGNFTINGTTTGTNTWEDAGNLVGKNVINGALTWVAGNWNGAPSVTITSNSSLLIVGGGGVNDLSACQFTNNGTVTWSNGTVRSGNGGMIVNNGLWNMTTDQVLNNAYGGAGTTFNNYGTLRKSGGAGEFANATYFQSGVVFNQLAGVIDVQNSTNGTQLDFQGGGQFSGGSVATNQFGLVVLSAGGFNINGTATSTNTWEDTGSLYGTNVIRGGLTWVGGTWNNTIVTVGNESTLIINTATGSHTMGGCILTNLGTVNWSGDELYVGNASAIYNFGTWNMLDDQLLNNFYGGPGAFFYNRGALVKVGGSISNQTQFAGVTLNQLAGSINIQTGNLVLTGVQNLTGGAVTGAGFTYLNGGNFTLNGATTATNTVDSASVMVGVNAINGGLTWQGGSWSGATVTVTTNSALVINAASGTHTMGGCTFTNNGTVTWSSDQLYAGNGSAVYNNGTWTATDDQTFNNYYGGPGAFFNNRGTLLKTGGSSSSQTLFSGVTFNQLAGLINVQTGNLTLNGTESFTGGATASTGSIFLGNGTFNINGAATGTNVIDTSAVLNGVNVINGGLTWQGGSWNNTAVTVATNSLLVINAASGTHTIGNCLFTNFGTVSWSNDELYSGNNASFYNYGLWLARDNQIFNNYYGGTMGFDNFGIFRKTGIAGGSTVFAGNLAFTNSGTLDCQAGNISLQGSYNLTGGTLNTAITGPSNYATISLAGAAALTGTISANLLNSYQPSIGNAFTNILYGSFSGAFTHFGPPSFDSWSTNYTPTGFYLAVTATTAQPVLIQSPQVSSNTFGFQFWAVNGDQYTVQDNTNLATTNWVNYTNITGNGTLYQFSASASNVPAIFYRVVQP
jgi:hypothetical protein